MNSGGKSERNLGGEKNIDNYAVLGVYRQATEQEIQRAFHRLSQQSHPDKVPGREAQVNIFENLIRNFGSIFKYFS